MASDREILKQIDIGRVNSNPTMSDSATAVKARERRVYTWKKTAQDTNATDNTAEFSFVELKRAGRVVAVDWTTDVNVAAHNTNTIQLTVSKRIASDPANAVVVANAITTVAGLNGFTAWTPKAITLVANAVTYAANTVLTFQALKANSGTKLDIGILSVDVEEGD